MGLALAMLLGGWRWYEGRKNALPSPKTETIEMPPYEHVGGILTVAAVGGILGAKLFHLIEYPDQFIAFFQEPSLNAFIGGLTIYGGLIVGGLSVYLYSRHYGLKFLNVADACISCAYAGIWNRSHRLPNLRRWRLGNPQHTSPTKLVKLAARMDLELSLSKQCKRRGTFYSESDPWAIYPGYGTCLRTGVYPTSLYETQWPSFYLPSSGNLEQDSQPLDFSSLHI